MTSLEFGEIVKQICHYLTYLSESNPKLIAACRTGEDFEQCVFDAAETTLATLGISATVFYTQGSHVFPDIVIQFDHGEKYGIEVKSSTSSNSRNWKINGNSVLGSTKEDVIDTYIIFGKTAIGNQGFRYKRYEDAIANVAVTHPHHLPWHGLRMCVASHESEWVGSPHIAEELSICYMGSEDSLVTPGILDWGRSICCRNASCGLSADSRCWVASE